MTYTEAKGKQSINWTEFLNRKGEEITYSEMKEAKILASNWTTCACGEQDSNIPRYATYMSMYRVGEPEDRCLADLGSDFSNLLGEMLEHHSGLLGYQEHSFESARLKAIETLERIQKRAIEILNSPPV